ncbi:MAG: SDR family oxidoreductase [Alphaproteobacteria bacterium]|nr:SDR family oxidoreductase [Alphaproteobacteria bacterium]
MQLQLNGRTALITGASAGIGQGIARVLALEGVRLALTARRAEPMRALADSLTQQGLAQPLVVPLDITQANASQRLAQAVLGQLGRLDILVNNAGSSRPTTPVSDDALWDEAMALNFSSVRRVTEAFLPGMRAQKWGRIVNITGTMEPLATNASAAAKSATHVWAKGLSRDLARDNITVNCIPPGRIVSEQIMQRLHPTEENRQAFIGQHIPVGYFGEPEDIGYLVAFLASPLARYITGEVIHVDGGMHRFAH